MLGRYHNYHFKIKWKHFIQLPVITVLAHQVIDRTYWYDEESGDDAWEWCEDYDEEEDLATRVSDQELQGTVKPH